jgi:WD40 repeat protein
MEELAVIHRCPALALAVCLGLLWGGRSAGEPPTPTPAAPEPPVTDRYGDPLPERAVARLGTLRFRHGGKVLKVVFSPDGKLLASAGENGIRLWDVRTGKNVRGLRLEGLVSAVAFSPDGKLLGADRGVWELSSGKRIYEKEARFISSTVFLPDDYPCHLIQFSPDGKTLVTAFRGLVLRSVATFQELRWDDGGDGVTTAVFSPDGKTIASGNVKGEVQLLDALTLKPLRQFQDRGTSVRAVAFSPDGKLLASSAKASDPADPAVRVWDVATGKGPVCLEGQKSTVNSLVFAPDGRTLVTGSQDRISLWDRESGKEVRQFTGHQGDVASVALSPDGKTLAAAGEDGTVRFWDAATGERIRPDDGHEGVVRSLAFSQDGTALASAGDDTVYLWDVSSRKARRRFEGRSEDARSVAFSPDGNALASGHRGGGLCLWDLTGEKEPRQLGSEGDETFHVAFAAGGSFLVSGQKNGLASVWDAASGNRLRGIGEVASRKEYQPEYSACALSPDGKVLVLGGLGLVTQLWRVADGKRILALEEEISGNAAAFSPDGKLLAVAGSDVVLCDATTGIEVRRLVGHRPWVSSLAFSPDGRTLASAGGDDEIRLWEVSTGKERRRFRGHLPGFFCVHAVAFSPDGRLLGSAGHDTTVLLWDVTGPPKEPPTMEQAWEDLAEDDATRAFAGVCALVRSPRRSVPFLAERLRPVPAVESRRLAGLIADLDSDAFAVREKATEELGALREVAEPALAAALAGKPSAEVRRRAKGLLARIHEPVPPPERLRELRGVEALEYLNPPEARELLSRLAKGASQARLTQEAKASLERLNNRTAGK